MPKQFLEAGKIVGTHGVRGDLKVQSWCDSPEVLCDFDTLVSDDKTPVTVARAQGAQKHRAHAPCGRWTRSRPRKRCACRVLHIDREDVELPDDLVFIQDILGFAVFDRRLGREIGRLRDVLTDNPAHDMYEVKTPVGKLVYIPASKPFLQEIDMQAGVIYIESIEGPGRMRIDIMTLFPEMIDAVMRESIIGRAQDKGLVSVRAANIRNYALDKHHKADDAPYGGGRGQVMLAEAALPVPRGAVRVASMCTRCSCPRRAGRFDQQKARELRLEKEHFILVCGHYEGVDQRFIDACVDEEISIGDFVLTGGEIPAMASRTRCAAWCRACCRTRRPSTAESHWDGLLEHPQYTRPENWRGREVPAVLLSGHHAKHRGMAARDEPAPAQKPTGPTCSRSSPRALQAGSEDPRPHGRGGDRVTAAGTLPAARAAESFPPGFWHLAIDKSKETAL